MLRTVADMLRGFSDEERKKLNSFDIKHAPTIGKMYEGLTSEILNRAIPAEMGLRIVSGVIFNDSGKMTGEIDCMLVEGEGIQIPYTSSFKWHVKDVICVFEVKKTLYSDELADSFFHLQEVLDSHSQYVQSDPYKGKINIESARKAFSMITKIVPPKHEDIQTLPIQEEMIYHTLIMEQLSPIRIVIGYNGFKSEFSFREAMYGFLQQNINKRGFGVGSFPQLIISEHFSLIKGNGQPYSPPILNGYWNFFLSSPENPIVFILELIWTRLQQKYNIEVLWEEGLKEGFHLFLSGRIVEKDGKIGWDYRYAPIEKNVLEEEYEPLPWEPVYIDQNQYVVIHKLCVGETVDITSSDFLQWLGKENVSVPDFIDSLLETGLIALKNNELMLTTEQCQCAFLPTGECVAAENNTGRLSRWIASRL
jgi:hypothetical protein